MSKALSSGLAECLSSLMRSYGRAVRDCDSVGLATWLEGWGTVAAVIVALGAYGVGARVHRYSEKRFHARRVGISLETVPEAFWFVNSAPLPVRDVEVFCERGRRGFPSCLRRWTHARRGRRTSVKSGKYRKVVSFHFTDANDQRWKASSARRRHIGLPQRLR
jgi:hypothetical protein